MTYENGEVIDQSGITFATGFDVGQYSSHDIKKFDFPKTLEEKLLPFAGVTKERAKDLLPLALQTMLTSKEANQIDFKVKESHLRSTIESWNTHKLERTPKFKDLTSAQQTVLLSRTFHQGPGM
ncbi:pesticin C-terminus-like muramidase, partial [Legionella maioricensis]|nr:pesticin C-terminus-like muramidase [Legionella maioricensis]